ncbi:MAG: hypothetical protein AAF512_06520 [Pseudomonadota bacterium]
MTAYEAMVRTALLSPSIFDRQNQVLLSLSVGEIWDYPLRLWTDGSRPIAGVERLVFLP